MSLENKIVTLAETIGTDVRELKNDKVDKEVGKGLSDTNFTQDEKDKLAGVASEATKNRDDSENADKLHTHTMDQVVGLVTALNLKGAGSSPYGTPDWPVTLTYNASGEMETATYTGEVSRLRQTLSYNGAGQLATVLYEESTDSGVTYRGIGVETLNYLTGGILNNTEWLAL